MRNYEEELTKAKETGKGIVVRFQEKPTYIEAINGYDCPHCGAKFGKKENSRGTASDMAKTNPDNYETPIDIEFMCNHIGYSWTEDCKCGNCGKMYSQYNGC